MQKPTDYPVDNNPVQTNEDASALPGDITYAVLRDRVNANQPVTDEMIQIAITQLETAHLTLEESKSSHKLITNLRNRFR